MFLSRWLEALRGLSRVEAAVLVAGICSMGLEILAGRIVAPVFGSSIYTWGTIIGVFLAALSLGYHRGGRQAARDASPDRIAALFVATTAFIGAVILFDDAFLTAVLGLPVSARFAPLIPVTLLFGPPVYLLGFISPYAAQLSEKDGTGAASGHVYALGTIGSIIGAFATTFVLIPALGIELIGLLFGTILLGAAVMMVRPLADRGTLLRVLGAGLLVAAAVATSTASAAGPGEVIYRTQTPYQEMQVIDHQGIRTLYLGGQTHSAMDLDDPLRHVFDYTRTFHLPLLMRNDTDRVLFIGGGGFTGPKRFVNDYDVTVDVVEIDPAVVRAAKRYFRVNETGRLRIHTMDGRRFLRETDATYDLIVLDAYQRDKVPFHMTTVEFMELAASRLDSQGVLFANVLSSRDGPASRFFRAEYRTLERAFPHVYAFATADTRFVQNLAVIATKRAERFTAAELQERNRERSIGIDLSDEISLAISEVPTDDVPVLEDGNAPVDRLLEPIAGRRYVIEQDAAP